MSQVAADYSTPQLTLNMRRNDTARWQNFDFSNTANVRAALKSFMRYPKGVIFLQGDRGVGKTHLLQATVTNAQENQQQAAYISALELTNINAGDPADYLEGYDSFALLAIDEVDILCQSTQWSLWLFHLYNRLMDNGGGMLLASHYTPRNLPCPLADLYSRLQKAELLSLQPLHEEGMQQQLQIRAHHLGLHLSSEVAKYIYLHSPRTMKDLMETLHKLDIASWQRQRKITIPFIKQTLGW